MTETRPNPDELLARVQAEENAAPRGKLKIFFGYAAGVGKTYAMLEAAQRARADGVDVVVGYVEPHGRQDTESLLKDLELLPPKQVPYRGIVLREFDLDAALARKPRLILVDELAHTNAQGLRHAKRWQDVEELLAAGIDVYTTLNVQHVESLNDVIAQITGVVVSETLPDSVLERADELELVDLTPEELIDRLREGKVYVPQQAARALEHFFSGATSSPCASCRSGKSPNGSRRTCRPSAATAQRPHRGRRRAPARLRRARARPAANLIRTAKRMAAAFGADWLAVAVESRRAARPGLRQRVAQHLRLAERLGAETHTLVGPGRRADRARIRPHAQRDQDRRRQDRPAAMEALCSPLRRRALLEQSGDIDVYVIRGEPEQAPRAVAPPAANRNCRESTTSSRRRRGHLRALRLAQPLAPTARSEHRHGASCSGWLMWRPALAAARDRRCVASVIVFDLFFVPPYLQFAVSDTITGHRSESCSPSAGHQHADDPTQDATRWPHATSEPHRRTVSLNQTVDRGLRH